MRLYRQKNTKVWSLDVTINGQRYRISLNTTDKREAKSLANKRIAEAEQGKITPSSLNFAKLSFGDAANKYLASRSLELAPSTYKKEVQLLVKLREFFQASRLNQLSSEQVLAYREWRSAQGVGPAIMNMEIGVLRRILKRAKRWHVIADDVKPLREPHSIGKALTQEQKHRLLTTAAQKPEWQTAYWAAILVLHTTMRGCELKSLRWRDIDLLDKSLTVPKSKTEAGQRRIPLTDEAYEILIQLFRRARTFGSVEQAHYVFGAFKATGNFHGNQLVEICCGSYDPTRPIGSWKKAWRSLTKQAELSGFRFHDLRHHAITELAESGASDQTIRAIAGHVSPRMLEIYSHIRMEAKRKAVQVFSKQKLEGYGIVYGIESDKPGGHSDVNLLVAQNAEIGAWGFEPQTPTVSR